MFYVQFVNGEEKRFETELDMYKSLYNGFYDEDGNEMKVACYGEIL